MRVTRDVILDLWPVYESGEATADTRALVEQFLQDDPEFARLVRENRGAPALRPTPHAMPRDSEMDALFRVQKLLSYRQSALLLAVAFFGLSAFLRLGRLVTLSLAILSLVAWVVLGLFGRRLFRLARRGGTP